MNAALCFIGSTGGIVAVHPNGWWYLIGCGIALFVSILVQQAKDDARGK